MTTYPVFVEDMLVKQKPTFVCDNQLNLLWRSLATRHFYTFELNAVF